MPPAAARACGRAARASRLAASVSAPAATPSSVSARKMEKRDPVNFVPKTSIHSLHCATWWGVAGQGRVRAAEGAPAPAQQQAGVAPGLALAASAGSSGSSLIGSGYFASRYSTTSRLSTSSVSPSTRMGTCGEAGAWTCEGLSVNLNNGSLDGQKGVCVRYVHACHAPRLGRRALVGDDSVVGILELLALV